MAKGKKPYQPKTGAKCACKRGQQRDNCPQCEGTGWVIDFAAIRARNKPKNRYVVSNLRIVREVDDSPDTSWIGEYTNEEKDGAIDRKERGDMERNEYRYFVPTLTGEQTGNPESPEQDYQRMESLNRGDWCFLGVYAKCDLTIFIDGQSLGTIHPIRSAGLWGIESDSEESYFDEVGTEELGNLEEQLRAMGWTGKLPEPELVQA